MARRREDWPRSLAAAIAVGAAVAAGIAASDARWLATGVLVAVTALATLGARTSPPDPRR